VTVRHHVRLDVLVWRATRDPNTVISEHLGLFEILATASLFCAHHAQLIMLGALTRRFGALVRLLDGDGMLERGTEGAVPPEAPTTARLG